MINYLGCNFDCEKNLLVGPSLHLMGYPKYVNDLFSSKFLNENYNISLFDMLSLGK